MFRKESDFAVFIFIYNLKKIEQEVPDTAAITTITTIDIVADPDLFFMYFHLNYIIYVAFKINKKGAAESVQQESIFAAYVL